ncbi:MAG: ankyrin repeat domain-containing protein [Myxococcales bacterium]|nr:ankyrin repeat domain-containing protein [Myxococcales bacterium]
MARRRVDRQVLIEGARLHHVLASISSIYYEDVSFSEWQGDEEQGSYAYDNGQGDRLTMRWLAPGPSAAAARRGPLCGLAFGHESERSQYERDEDERTLEALGALPLPLRALAEGVADEMERLVTAGMWTVGDGEATLTDEVGPSTHWAHGLEMYAGFALPGEQALFGDRLLQSWLEAFSLDEAHARLALRLAEQSRRGPLRVEADAQQVLLTVPLGDTTRVLAPRALETAATQLGQLGIRWRVPRAELTARNRWARAQRRAQAASETADPPLVEAIKGGRYDAALALVIAEGVELDARNAFGQTALNWAARRDATEVGLALLQRGADATLAETSGLTPLHFAAQEGNAKLVQALLERGADPRAENYSGVTPIDRAGMHQRASIVALLRRWLAEHPA